MVKLKINGVDLLPYILISLTALSFLFFQLSVRDIMKLKYEKVLGGLGFILFLITAINYIKKIHSPEGVNLPDLISTEDIRTPSFKYGGFVNQGQNISFVKFYFSQQEIYMYYRNFFPIKIYYGPFTINKRGCVSFSNFYIKEFAKTSNNEAKVSIVSESGATK
ncbi:hypothetical protein SAMN05443292_1843 [Halpernia frigidisoli]|uniref:Uncharacterized protein n=2 Tax=Halpernia frigidisoli TaxID=1125876 RepID=A0A1I3GHV7_9FLAO|nr:hypothetical protein SAMN05443292_1843 [Halpernia frigidisoli]